MNNTNKFLLNLRDFDAPVIEEEIIEKEIETEPPPPVFSEEEMETAKAVAHATGRNEGIQEERASRDQLLTKTLQNISDSFSTLFAAELYREKQYEEEAIKLGLQILDLLAPSLQTRLGKEALKEAIKESLKTQESQSEIKIEVHPDTASDINDMIDNIWTDKDSAPRYKITADNTLEIGACNISWKDGGMVREPQKIAAEVKKALESLLVNQVLSDKKPDNTAQQAEQVDENAHSTLTNGQNNDINNKQAYDSSTFSEDNEGNGETKND